MVAHAQLFQLVSTLKSRDSLELLHGADMLGYILAIVVLEESTLLTGGLPAAVAAYGAQRSAVLGSRHDRDAAVHIVHLLERCTIGLTGAAELNPLASSERMYAATAVLAVSVQESHGDSELLRQLLGSGGLITALPRFGLADSCVQAQAAKGCLDLMYTAVDELR